MRSEKSVGPKVIFSVLYIRYLNISHNAPYIFPPKFCISIVFSFSWNDSNAQDKWKTKVMQFFWGGGGGGRKQRKMWSMESLRDAWSDTEIHKNLLSTKTQDYSPRLRKDDRLLPVVKKYLCCVEPPEARVKDPMGGG